MNIERISDILDRILLVEMIILVILLLMIMLPSPKIDPKVIEYFRTCGNYCQTWS